VNRDGVGPISPGEGGEPLHPGVRIVVGQQAQPLRDLDRVPRGPLCFIGDSPDPKRCPSHGLELSLQRRELHRLVPRDEARADVAAKRHEHGGGPPDREGDLKGFPMEQVLPVFQEKVRMDPRDREPGCGEGGERHVERLVERGWIEHRREGGNVDRLPVRKGEARRAVHPGVGGNDEDPGEDPAEGHENAGCEVKARGDAIPPVQVDSEEDRLGEEGESLQREGEADDSARECHEPGPQETQLEGQDGSGDRAHREENRRPFRPAPRQLGVDRLAGPEMRPLGDYHQDRHPHPRHREENVEGEQHRHLGARQGKLRHAVPSRIGRYLFPTAGERGIPLPNRRSAPWDSCCPGPRSISTGKFRGSGHSSGHGSANSRAFARGRSGGSSDFPALDGFKGKKVQRVPGSLRRFDSGGWRGAGRRDLFSPTADLSPCRRI